MSFQELALLLRENHESFWLHRVAQNDDGVNPLARNDVSPDPDCVCGQYLSWSDGVEERISLVSQAYGPRIFASGHVLAVRLNQTAVEELLEGIDDFDQIVHWKLL